MNKSSKVELIDKADEINSKISEIQKKIVELRKIIEKELVYGESEEVKIAKAFYGTNTLTKELYDAFVEGVMIYSMDRIEVRFRFGDEFSQQSK